MIGNRHIVIRDKRVKYDFTIDRKVTIIKGNSGTGKTTLYNLISSVDEYSDENIGVSCNLKDSVVALRKYNYESVMSGSNKIVFIDEGFKLLGTKEFARDLQNSDNYFVIVTRKLFFSYLTYSVYSIFELETVKEGSYNLVHFVNKYIDNTINFKPDMVICEDSNSGYEMFKSILNCKLLSANGKDNIYNVVLRNIDSIIYIIADGAAFGNVIGVMSYLLERDNIHLFLPESFEYMILLSNSFSRYLSGELINTYKYCDTSKFLTWEQYYTFLLDNLCKSNYRFSYNKSRLHKFFNTVYFKRHIRNLLVDLDDSSFKEI